jgi:transposase-like protein
MNTIKTDKEMELNYLNGNGTQCPRCNSEDITWNGIESDISPWQEAHCNKCDLQWREFYKLEGIEILGE